MLNVHKIPAPKASSCQVNQPCKTWVYNGRGVLDSSDPLLSRTPVCGFTVDWHHMRCWKPGAALVAICATDEDELFGSSSRSVITIGLLESVCVFMAL
ncbi:hypothetical protein NPIL_242561 [Nephila pilipes]|uniref:Uncharacterized protein n=1 Tax=Nephila pilipes TaxID=299642 RepID=A0A8X6PQQ7_NEPPI|nr:hypothetical protein NPIL_242561 [Nephila pilipes]